MKKKLTKKLSLHRETLALLEPDLQAVAGGARTDLCPYSGQNTCTTCVFTCTSNYC